MDISISKNQAAKEAYKHIWFDTRDPVTRSNFAKLITSKVWSPCVWGGKRLKRNFISCHYLTLDFDEGFTLAQAEKWLQTNNFAGILGTSKSHQKDKVTPSGKVQPACDRFRLVVPFTKALTDLDEYEINMAAVMESLPCDPSCKDGARFFYPCKEIVFSQQGGHYPPLSEEEIFSLKEQKRKHLELIVSNSEVQREKSVIPSWVHEILKYGVDESDSRHQYAYKIGATLENLGYAEAEVVGVLMTSNISEIGVEDVRRAVHNGYARSLRDKRDRTQT